MSPLLYRLSYRPQRRSNINTIYILRLGKIVKATAERQPDLSRRYPLLVDIEFKKLVDFKQQFFHFKRFCYGR